MILSKKVKVTINYLNIEHYKSFGFQNLSCNQKIEVDVLDLPLNSNHKIEVKCDICETKKIISYQKYNKNIKKRNIYSCSTKCSMFKNKLTLKEKYGQENFNRSEENQLKKKIKFDQITENIEQCGYIVCSKCNTENDISHYIKNINGRYKRVCRACRTAQILQNRKIKDLSEYYRKCYRKNIHIYAWRNLLKNYLNRKSLDKIDTTYNLLKYYPDDLRTHLESLFTDKMNWSNYGEYWQIDHIIPVSLFRDDAPIEIVNGLENLRPLVKEENNFKKNKIDGVDELIVEKYKTYFKKKV